MKTIEINKPEDFEQYKKSEKIDANLRINCEIDANNLRSVGGSLYIYSQAKLYAKNLRSVGGSLYIDCFIGLKLEKQLFKWNHKKRLFRVTDKCSEWLLTQVGKFEYFIDNVKFNKDLFDKIRKNKMSAKEVFQINNAEHRRVAYEKLDKIKLKELNLKVLDKVKDKYSNMMKVVEFKIDSIEEPFRFFYCICPSTNREYFIETQSKKCNEAKAKSFGFDKLQFREEW